MFWILPFYTFNSIIIYEWSVTRMDRTLLFKKCLPGCFTWNDSQGSHAHIHLTDVIRKYLPANTAAFFWEGGHSHGYPATAHLRWLPESRVPPGESRLWAGSYCGWRPPPPPHPSASHTPAVETRPCSTSYTLPYNAAVFLVSLYQWLIIKSGHMKKTSHSLRKIQMPFLLLVHVYSPLLCLFLCWLQLSNCCTCYTEIMVALYLKLLYLECTIDTFIIHYTGGYTI